MVQKPDPGLSNFLTQDKKTGLVSANIQNLAFPELAKHLANLTNGDVNWDKNLSFHRTTSIFKDLPMHMAIGRLLVNQNFAKDKKGLRVFAPANFDPFGSMSYKELQEAAEGRPENLNFDL